MEHVITIKPTALKYHYTSISLSWLKSSDAKFSRTLVSEQYLYKCLSILWMPCLFLVASVDLFSNYLKFWRVRTSSFTIDKGFNLGISIMFSDVVGDNLMFSSQSGRGIEFRRGKRRFGLMNSQKRRGVVSVWRIIRFSLSSLNSKIASPTG